MTEILQLTTTGAALIALIFAFMSWLLSRSTEKDLETVRTDSKNLREQMSEIKAQVQHVDLEYIKKILVRVSDHETGLKRLQDSLDLTDEKLKSFMNRVNARGPRPSKPEAEKEEEPSQEDLLEQLKASGQAIPLRSPAGDSHPPTFVRASAARKRAG